MPGTGDENPLQDARMISFPQQQQQKTTHTCIAQQLITFQYNF